MSTLDALLPLPRKVEIDSVELAATPATVWDYIRNRDLADSALVRALFAMRTLPSRLVGGETEGRTVLRLDDLRSTPEAPGFQLLAEAPLSSVTVGAIGKVWQLDIPFRHVADARAYATFQEPGWVRVAWEIRVEALGKEHSSLSFEVRVDATDDDSWKKFTRYWRLVGPGSHLIRHVILAALRRRFGTPGGHEAEGRLARDTLADVGRGISGAAIMALALLSPFWRDSRNHWGLSEARANAPQPGDELVAAPDWSWTHAVEISASCDQVWPWVAQIGADRAGFYSYQWLENLVGCNIKNAETIHAEWQHQLGDTLVLHPEMPAIPIVAVEPGRALVAFAPPDAAARADGRPWAAVSWAFVLEPLGDDACRLISRFRAACSSDLATRLAHGPWLLEPIGFAMDRRMLLGIRDRAHAALESDRHA